MNASAPDKTTERISDDLADLELRDNTAILSTLAQSQSRAINAATNAIPALNTAVEEASRRLGSTQGRLVMIGAGASGRLAVQDGAELWPTYGWPASRLLLSIAGGESALLRSIEGGEDNVENARHEVETNSIDSNDVVVGLAASGSSAWTVAWIEHAREAGALTIGMANNAQTPLILASQCPVFLDSGAEVLAGSTRMAAGTAQKEALNMFSTLLMIRLNRTYGNLMVDMAAINSKLDDRRLRMLNALLPDVDTATSKHALEQANGWVKLAALICLGCSRKSALQLLEQSKGSLRMAMHKLKQ